MVFKPNFIVESCVPQIFVNGKRTLKEKRKKEYYFTKRQFVVFQSYFSVIMLSKEETNARMEE
jgi:hypothetical protein